MDLLFAFCIVHNVEILDHYLPASVGDGVCFTAERRPVMFGVNATAGCLLAVSQYNLTQCDVLR